MSKDAVFCIAGREKQANRIISQLKDAGFSGNDISVLFPDKSTTKNFAHEKNSDETSRAKKIFELAGARAISTAGERSIRKSSPSTIHRPIPCRCGRTRTGWQRRAGTTPPVGQGPCSWGR